MNENQTQQTQISKTVSIADGVMEKIRQFQSNNELKLPANYSPENALKAAWLILQQTVNRDKQPVLQVCTKESVANALLDMVVQGLNPTKKQGYFIAYGLTLTFQRSYFGAIAIAKETCGAKDVWAQPIYKGDEFEYTIERGRKKILKHNQKFENIISGNIIGAYCVIEFGDGRPDYVEMMTIAQITQAWKQGTNYREQGGVHQKFDDEMVKKTVINRATKTFINSSNDSNLFMESFNRTEEIVDEAAVDQEIAANANVTTIDITPGTSGQMEAAPTTEAPVGLPGQKQPTSEAPTVEAPTDKAVSAAPEQPTQSGLFQTTEQGPGF